MPKGSSMREGWGIAHRVNPETGKDELITTDSTSTISFFDVDSWKQTSTITVRQNDLFLSELIYLNELEIIDDVREGIDMRNYLFANYFQSNNIFLVDLRSGYVIKRWNMHELTDKNHQWRKTLGLEYTSYESLNAVLNGIAYYPPNDTFILTGKLWDVIFEVKLDYWDVVKENELKLMGKMVKASMLIFLIYIQFII